MGLERLKAQLELSKKALSEINQQNAIFDKVLTEAVKGVPEEHKQQMEDLRFTTRKAIDLAKAGKNEEAQQIIKDFQNGR